MSVHPYIDKTGKPVPHKFRVDIYQDGSRRQQVISNVTRAQAETIAARMRRGGRKPLPTDPTVQDVYPDWLTDYARHNSPGTVGDIQGAFLKLMPHFGKLHLTELQPEHFRTYMDKRALDTWRPPGSKIDPRPISKGTVNKEIKYLAIMIRWATTEMKLPELGFIIPKFRKLKTPPKVLPPPREVTDILDRLDPLPRLAVLLFHDAGLRKSEAYNLRREDVHLQEHCIDVLGKGQKWRTVPIITERLHQALQARLTAVEAETASVLNPATGKPYRRGGRLSPNSDGYLFFNPKTGRPIKDLCGAIKSAAEDAGSGKRIYNHLFRHAHITNSLEAGVDLRTVQENAGHADLKTTQVYMHQRKTRRIEESRKLAAFLEQPPDRAHTIPVNEKDEKNQ